MIGAWGEETVSLLVTTADRTRILHSHSCFYVVSKSVMAEPVLSCLQKSTYECSVQREGGGGPGSGKDLCSL
jgi:hypothetical protein